MRISKLVNVSDIFLLTVLSQNIIVELNNIQQYSRYPTVISLQSVFF